VRSVVHFPQASNKELARVHTSAKMGSTLVLKVGT
jgi:hypothetical protein